jgi:hypothetical protein
MNLQDRVRELQSALSAYMSTDPSDKVGVPESAENEIYKNARIAMDKAYDAIRLADHLESEPSGGLREAAQEACDYYFQEHGHYEYVIGQHDENMRAIREALAASRDPQWKAASDRQKLGPCCEDCGHELPVHYNDCSIVPGLRFAAQKVVDEIARGEGQPGDWRQWLSSEAIQELKVALLTKGRTI